MTGHGEPMRLHRIVEIQRDCWKCGESTPLFVPTNAEGYKPAKVPLWTARAIAVRHGPYHKGRAKGKEVWANHCVHCEVVQGNAYAVKALENLLDDHIGSLMQLIIHGIAVEHEPILLDDIRRYVARRKCALCGVGLQPIGSGRVNGRMGVTDWSSRKLHSKCWRDLQEQQVPIEQIQPIGAHDTRAFVFEFNMDCWKCGAGTPVIFADRPASNVAEDEYEPSGDKVTPDDDEAMGRVLSSEYPFYRRGYSKTMESNVYASFCTSCDAMQGNWFVRKEMIFRWSSENPPEPSRTIEYYSSLDAVSLWESD